VDQPYRPEDYQFPEAYVEGVESSRYLVLYPERGRYRLVSEPPREGIVLGQTIYEEAGQYAFDLVEAKTTRWIAVRIPWRGYKVLALPPETRVLIYEIGGVQTVFQAREGDRVKPGDIAAYVLTGKGETRSRRFDEEAIVFYIAWDRESHPPVYRVITVEPEKVIVLEPE